MVCKLSFSILKLWEIVCKNWRNRKFYFLLVRYLDLSCFGDFWENFDFYKNFLGFTPNLAQTWLGTTYCGFNIVLFNFGSDSPRIRILVFATSIWDVLFEWNLLNCCPSCSPWYELVDSHAKGLVFVQDSIGYFDIHFKCSWVVLHETVHLLHSCQDQRKIIFFSLLTYPEMNSKRECDHTLEIIKFN